MRGAPLERVLVSWLPGGRLLARAGAWAWPAVGGRCGLSRLPLEGDGATPATVVMRPLMTLFRADRVARPRTMLPARALRPDDGWCDAPTHACYNRLVRHPFPASAERLWRADGVYDLVVVLDFNTWPRSRGRGSAIFMHVMHDDGRPTAGCIAMRMAHLLRLVEAMGPCTRIVVRG